MEGSVDCAINNKQKIPYDIKLLEDILVKEEEEVVLKTQKTIGSSMEERKPMARSAGFSGFQRSIQKRPTSISQVICKERER